MRVALYFPAERDQVEKLIRRVFNILGSKKKFPDPGAIKHPKRFSGYWAEHYRVQLKENELSELDKRYATAQVEIQVASVLMHAWAEVEHDLVYKPLEGDLSDDEYAILDQLNGLVLAGEIALERLQKAGEARVANRQRKFRNHYELAVHLLGHAGGMSGEPVDDTGLGRVDLLFDLLGRLGLDTPADMAQYLDALHGNLEVRPLAEQVIDALLAEDDSRYDVYSLVRGEHRQSAFGRAPEDQDLERQVGIFLARWIKLEKLLRSLMEASGQRKPTMPIRRDLERLELLNADQRGEIDFLRRMRNHLVHGIETPDAGDLAAAAQRLDSIVAEIEGQQ